MTKNLLATPKLGFGLMRLPVEKDHPDVIDHEQVCRMVDLFMEAGLTYYDTAFVYGRDGASEKAAKACLVDRYPRESFTLATKINAWLMAEDEKAAKASSTPASSARGRAILTFTFSMRFSPILINNMTNIISGITWLTSRDRA